MEKNEIQNNLEKSDAATPKSGQALREERVLEFWKEKNIFQKSLDKKSPKGEFIFYDGPPTANGKPGTHHLIPGSFKDAIPRYKTMRGYHVRRKRGWDTHGLPVELQVEKKLGLNSKKAIEEYGIAKFNQECKDSVWEYVDLWHKFTERIGFWVDQENPYVTYHNEYIESVWNIVKKVDGQKLLYKDYKVLPWCPRCGTALSSHELAQGYETDKDLSVYAKFKITGPSTGSGRANTYLLAWTTTPWTLPGNVALAVGENIDYVKIKKQAGPSGENEFLILAKERLEVVEGEYKVIQEMKGKELLGLAYEPLYPNIKDYLSTKKHEPFLSQLNAGWKVYNADFVNTEDGTGIVHTAVMYGQDDFELGVKVGLPKYHTVDATGHFNSEAPDFLKDRFVKDEEVAVDIIKDLAHRGLLFKKEKYEHQYPHCWRCHTALIYYARDSWYIRMSDPLIRQKLIEENQKIRWEPAHIRDGRFGEWLKEIKDWAVSRERYWGTPLPAWECGTCKERHIAGSVEDLKKTTVKSGNRYVVMRHGQSESNIENSLHGVVSSRVDNVDHLTKAGEEEVRQTAKKLKEFGRFDFIFVSPFMRTRETLAILKEELGFKDEQIIFDKRFGELDAGEFEGKPWDEYRDMFKNERERFVEPIHGGESLVDVKRRVGDAIYELEKNYRDKNILIVSHGAPLWMLFALLNGYDVEQSINMTGGVFRHAEEIERGLPGSFSLFRNAEYRTVDFVSIPHNENYELDLHRPYIDEVKLVCPRSTSSGQACGGDLVRTPEVMDVWLDSGAMPFAEDHYPFENKKWVEGPGYPADFISEAIDQTRGWFYTLHAVGVLMGRGRAYKNVICLGHLLDAQGKKMSKSLGNVVDPWLVIDKYGVDTLRLWMYSVNQPGESKNFDEKTVALLSQQVFGLLYNVIAFYELYPAPEQARYGAGRDKPKSKNVLDLWILEKLDQLTDMMTANLDNYKLLEPTRAMRDFIGDLSTWYLRRSRERIKSANTDDSNEAKQTLYFVLKTLAKLMAPFAPFAAEDIWSLLKNSDDAESVHLAKWPKKRHRSFLLNLFRRPEALEQMETVRNIVTLGLEARQSAGIKVRQPLRQLEIVAEKLKSPYLEIIKDELNVKNIHYTLQIKIGITKVHLDTVITTELKEEGDYRELSRAMQNMRKQLGLTPDETVTVTVATDEAGRKLVQKFEAEIKKTVLASEIRFGENNGKEIKIDGLAFKIKIVKV